MDRGGDGHRTAGNAEGNLIAVDIQSFPDDCTNPVGAGGRIGIHLDRHRAEGAGGEGREAHVDKAGTGAVRRREAVAAGAALIDQAAVQLDTDNCRGGSAVVGHTQADGHNISGLDFRRRTDRSKQQQRDTGEHTNQFLHDETSISFINQAVVCLSFSIISGQRSTWRHTS